MSYFDDTENLDDITGTYEEWQEAQKYKDKYNTVFCWLKSIYTFRKDAKPAVFEHKRMHDNLLQVVAVMKSGERISFGFWHDKHTVDKVQRMFDNDSWGIIARAMALEEASK